MLKHEVLIFYLATYHIQTVHVAPGKNTSFDQHDNYIYLFHDTVYVQSS